MKIRTDSMSNRTTAGKLAKGDIFATGQVEDYEGIKTYFMTVECAKSGKKRC